MKHIVRWRFVWVLAMVLGFTSLAFVSAAKAQDEAPEEESTDLSWLDPDKKVYVLQNRKYRKAFRPALYLSGGKNLSNSYRSGWMGSVRAGMWFTEQFGVEAFGTFYKNSDSDNLKALRAVSTVLPFVREVRSYFGGVATWAPFYGKLNLFNWILYYDWALNLGLGSVNTANDRNTISGASSRYVTENFVGVFFGTSQNFYVSKHFSVRWDLVGVNYGATGADDRPKRFTNVDFLIGAGYLF